MTSMEWAALAIGTALLATRVTLAVGLTRHCAFRRSRARYRVSCSLGADER